MILVMLAMRNSVFSELRLQPEYPVPAAGLPAHPEKKWTSAPD